MNSTAPKPLKPGQTLLLTYNESNEEGQRGGIWILAPHLSPEDDSTRDVLKDAQECWTQVARLTLQSLPYLWKSPDSIIQRRLYAQHAPGTAGGIALDDTSFGLSFALAIVSELTDSPLPVDFAASAVVNIDTGELLPVQGLEEKIKALVCFAPQIHRLFVASEQATEAHSIVQSFTNQLEITSFKHIKEAIQAVFPAPQAPLLAKLENSGPRQQLLDDIFRLCAASKSLIPSWQPVRDALALIRCHSSDFSEEQAQALQFSLAIASRHTEDQGELDFPPHQWLQTLPQPLPTELLAHLTQQAASTGTPPPRETLEFVSPFLVRGPGAFPAHLKLLGAVGRLHASLGEFQRALKTQLEALDGWYERAYFIEVSHPLSFAFRLSGILQDQNTFDDLLRREARWLNRLEVSESDRFYVTLAKARANIALGRPEKAAFQLQSCLGNDHVGTTNRSIAAVHLTHALELLGQGNEAASLIGKYALGSPEALAESLGLSGLLPHHIYHLLNLSRALVRSDLLTAHHHLEELIAKKCYAVQVLVENSDLPYDELPHLISRAHPY